MNSTKSVSDKLNFAKYPNKLVINLPEGVEGFSEVTYDSSIQEKEYDLLFIFIFSLEEFRDHLQKIIEQKLVKDNGYVYFAYPKKNNNKYEAYIDRDSIYNGQF
ncbi:hypothetical protein [Bacillus coahuilensis]|uniref:hypothetical protein n=1 Tax=Bacillus coahuilensis TaxID=408580 RepID=UPI0007502AEC|nr:hypothetical protein [Bacillus coahuilensis]